MTHFIDMNRTDLVLDLPFISMTRRCEEVERRVEYLCQLCESYRIPLTGCSSLREISSLTV